MPAKIRMIRVMGMTMGAKKGSPALLTVRLTNGAVCETLSIAAEGELELMVPFETMERLIKETRRDNQE